MPSIDTNVLLRLMLRDDDEQTVKAEAFVMESAWVSVLALAEAIWVLGTVYRLQSERLVTIVEMLLAHKELVLQEHETVAAALELFRSEPRLGFSDCLMLNLSKASGTLPLGTFDRALSKVEGTLNLQL